MKHFSLFLFCAVATASAAFAQKWEVGAGIGGAFYTSQSFSNAGASATGSLSNGPVVSAWLGNNSGNHLGGEFRYDYEFNNLELNGGGTHASFGAQTQSFHYDFLFHFTPREAHVRPFVAAGGGIRMFRGTGTEQAFQPLSNLALLTKTSQIEGLVSVGGGVKLNLSSMFQLRLEVHDYLSPFPNKVIAPGLGAKGGSGWLQDFVPMAALAIMF